MREDDTHQFTSEEMQEILEFNRINAEKVIEESNQIHKQCIIDSLKELREWLCSGGYTGESHALGENHVIKPILTEDSEVRVILFNKAKELIKKL